jgi:hypothetical protein
MKVLEKYVCHPLYKFSKDLDHPEFDSRGGQASVLFIKMSCPFLRKIRPLNGERDLSLEVKRKMCEADHFRSRLKMSVNTLSVQDKDNFILRSRVRNSGKVM